MPQNKTLGNTIGVARILSAGVMIFLVVTLFYMAISCQQLHFYLFAGVHSPNSAPFLPDSNKKCP